MKIMYQLIIVLGLVLSLGLSVAMGDRENHRDRDFNRDQYYENSGTFLQDTPYNNSNEQIDNLKEPADWKGRIWYFPDRWCEVQWPNAYVCHYY